MTRYTTIVVISLLASSALAQSDATDRTGIATSPGVAEPAPAPVAEPTPGAEPIEQLAGSVASELRDTPPPLAASLATETSAPPAPTESVAESALSLAGRVLSELQIHGFVSQGGFVSTANDYIGNSSRGSLKFFEAGINFALEPADQLRVGLQFVFRNVGVLSEDVPRVDWALIDYRWTPWFGMRAGLIKMPLGLYNEYVDIDSARTAILLPQSVYPVRNRDALIAHTGFAIYGNIAIGGAGYIDYQAWLGTLTIPSSALELTNARLASTDTKYIAGGQIYWRPPLEGLRVGATYLRASIDFNVVLDAGLVAQAVAMEYLPPGHDGKLRITHDPTSFWVGSAEYIVGDWLFAAEYSRWLKHEESTVPILVPTRDEDAERFYAMATYRVSKYFEFGLYYAVTHADVRDRDGEENARFTEPFQGFQRDLAASFRFDVNEYWLWKLEAHFIDGVAELQSTVNLNPKRHWGLFLLKTTVMF
jgi:hypothetical protein